MTDLTEAAQTFSSALRDATWEEHGAAEQSPFLRALFSGQLSRSDYARMVVQQWFIYDALERATDAHRGDPVVALFAFDELRRLPALEADLRFLLGGGWRDHLVAIPATAEYAARITEAADGSSGGLVAHHYTRYMGDLSGGFHIGRTVTRVLELSPPDGVRFFEFAAIEDPKAFKDEYRRLLDEAPWSSAEQAEVVAETVRAYRFNSAVFASLEP